MARTPNALIHPALLVWARKSAGLSLELAAERIGVDAERLGAWELGDPQPTIAQLRTCAEVYRRPLAVFFLPTPPKDFSVPFDYRRLTNVEAGTFSPEARTEMRRVQFQREVALQVAAPDASPAFDLLGTATISSNVETTATEIRQQLGVTLTEQFGWPDEYAAFNSWRRAVEGLGSLVFHAERISLGELRGFSICHSRLPIVAVNGHDSINGRTFSLMHELGHLLLNRAGTCDLEESGTARTDDQRVESFCNALAASILLPAEAMREHFGLSSSPQPQAWPDDVLQQASRRFRVSREAILRRLVSLGAATFGFYLTVRQRLLEQYAVADAKKKEQSGTGGPHPASLAIRRVGPSFARLMFDAYDRDEITTNDLSEYLGVRVKQFDKVRDLAFATTVDGGDE